MGFFSSPPEPPSPPAQPSRSAAPNPLISVYRHLSSLERADEALKIIHQLASRVIPIMRKRNWKVGTLAEFLPDHPALQGLNTNFGQIINIRLRPARAPNTFYDMEILMDTMLHELVHNVYSEHDKLFYGLLEELKREWELLSSKGYQGEGFFSRGQRLGSGNTRYKPSIAATTADIRSIKDAAERRAAGITVGPNGRRLGGDHASGEGRRLGGVDIEEISPRQLAAMAAEQRARDQKRCGAKQGGADMRRETERAQREGTTTQARDIGKVIDLNDLQNYDWEDTPTSPPAMNGFATPPTSTINNPFLGDWNCQQCTFRNPPLYLSCQVCQTERKLLASTDDVVHLTEEFGISWECQACTFANENNTDGKCIICSTEI